MPRYSYTARTASGERLTAVADAASLPALAEKLSSEGARIQTAYTVTHDAPTIRGIPYFEVLGIYRQIASAVQAGMPLKESLGMLSGESRNPKLKVLLRFLESEVGEGMPLSESMARFSRIFPPVHVAVVKAGEESERLGTVLEGLAEQAETFSNMNRRFASALVYPTVIAVAALALLNFSFLAILPKISELFSDLGIRDLPLISRIVLTAGKFVAPVTLMLILAAAAMIAVIFTQRKASSGRLWIDKWKLRLPLVGQIVEKASLARFAGTLGVLLDSGIELPRALDMAAEGAGNGTIEQILKNVSIDVERGRTLSESIDLHQAMPPTMAWRIGVGEESGALAESLTSVGGLYAKQVDSLVTSLAGFVEPMLIIVVGSGVLMLVLGLFLPIVQVIQSLCGVGM